MEISIKVETQTSTFMEISIFYGNFEVKWNFLWNWDNDRNSMEISMCRKYCKLY